MYATCLVFGEDPIQMINENTIFLQESVRQSCYLWCQGYFSPDVLLIQLCIKVFVTVFSCTV